MAKQILIRVDDEIKIIADAIMKVRGETQQIILERAYIDYVFEHINSVGTNNGDLLQTTYNYVIERQKADIAPLLAKMEEYQITKAAEEAKQVELMELYNKVINDATGKNLLDIFVRRLDYQDQYRAFSDMYVDNEKLMQRLFEMSDDNEIIKASISLARIHTTQT